MWFELLSKRKCIACGKEFYSEYRDEMCEGCLNIFDGYVNQIWTKVKNGEIKRKTNRE